MKKHSRAQRRHDRARLKKKRRNHWGYGRDGWRSYCHVGINEMPKDVAGMVVDTPTPCSCYMCGNPRSKKSWASGLEKITIQERKANESLEAGVDELLDLDTYRWEKYDDFYDAYYSDDVIDWYLRWMYIKNG